MPIKENFFHVLDLDDVILQFDIDGLWQSIQVDETSRISRS